jgi:hypothetical protein
VGAGGPFGILNVLRIPLREEKMKIIPIVRLTLLTLVSSGCSHRREPEPIVIHILRDRAATEIETALLAVGAKQLKSSSGQPVMIATIEPKSYAEGLESLGHLYHPELVIFNSLEDGKRTKVEVSPQSAVRVASRQFYLVIPSWVPREQRQTAELVLVEVRKELEKI